MEELKDIITELEKVIKSKDLDINDSELFAEAVKIFISNRINKEKNIRVADMKQQIENKNKPELATPLQIFTIEKATGKKADRNLTKREASQMISKIKEGAY